MIINRKSLEIDASDIKVLYDLREHIRADAIARAERQGIRRLLNWLECTRTLSDVVKRTPGLLVPFGFDECKTSHRIAWRSRPPETRWYFRSKTTGHYRELLCGSDASEIELDIERGSSKGKRTSLRLDEVICACERYFEVQAST